MAKEKAAKEKVVKEKAAKENSAKEKGAEKASKNKTPAAVNPILSLEKRTKIELQNILFGTTEKKLMVSDDFLNKMTIKYISKRMKIINTAFSNLNITRSAVFFFKNTSEIEKYIEDLIVLEKYYPFKNPVPSIYKRNYFAHKPAAITGMINRCCKAALQKYPLNDNTPTEEINPVALDYYEQVINEMLTQKDNYSEKDMEMINSFYIRTHGEQTEAEPTEPLPSEENDLPNEENIGDQSEFSLDLDGNDI